MNRDSLRRSPFRRAASTRDFVLLGVALVLILTAVLYFWHSAADNGIPTDSSSYVYFKCQACGERFYLNGKEIEQALRAGSGGPKSMKQTLFKCKKCGQLKAIRDEKQSP